MYHFKVKIIWDTVYYSEIKEVQWLNIFADLYGMRTNSYDGYVKDLLDTPESLELTCYLVDDPVKMAKWKATYPNTWKNEQLNVIKNAIIAHIKYTNLIIKDIIIQDNYSS
jgi:hypothetical protein